MFDYGAAINFSGRTSTSPSTDTSTGSSGAGGGTGSEPIHFDFGPGPAPTEFTPESIGAAIGVGQHQLAAIPQLLQIVTAYAVSFVITRTTTECDDKSWLLPLCTAPNHEWIVARDQYTGHFHKIRIPRGETIRWWEFCPLIVCGGGSGCGCSDAAMCCVL